MEKIKRLPEDLRRLELGQLFDGRKNEFINYSCLDLEQADNSNMLKVSNNDVTESFSFSHKSNSASESGSLNIAGGVKGQGWGVSLAATYAHYNEKATASKSQVIKAEAYKVKTAGIELKNFVNEPEKIFDALRESNFKKDWAAIRNESNGSLKKALIVTFKQKWGTGMIVKLSMIAGAVAELKFESNSDKDKSFNAHEASLKLESSVVSGEGKLSMSKLNENLNLSVSQVGTTICFPAEDIDSYKKYVDTQVQDLKKYIEKQEPQVKDPEFKGGAAIKPIKMEELIIKSNGDAVKSSLIKKVQDKFKPLRSCFVKTTPDKLIKALDLFSAIEEEFQEIYMKGYSELADDFDNLKASFKNDLLNLLKEEAVTADLKSRHSDIVKLSVYPAGKKTSLFDDADKKKIKEKLKP